MCCLNSELLIVGCVEFYAHGLLCVYMTHKTLLTVSGIVGMTADIPQVSVVGIAKM